MRPWWALLLYLVWVLVGGALLAPWVYDLAQRAAIHAGGLQALAQQPFHRYVHRTMLLLAVGGLWPLLHSVNIRSWRQLGLAPLRPLPSAAACGFALGLGSLAVVVVAVLLGGARRWTAPWAEAPGYFLGAAGTTLAVAVLEEVLFRGVLFGALRQAMRWEAALVVSSVIYAWLHFLARPNPPAQVTWSSGLVMLPQMLRGLGDLHALVPALLTLTWIGLLLGWAYQRSGTLFFSMGLHAGWIFWLRAYTFLTQPTPGVPPAFWGSNQLIDGWLALLVLVLASPWVNGWLPPKRKYVNHDALERLDKELA